MSGKKMFVSKPEMSDKKSKKKLKYLPEKY